MEEEEAKPEDPSLEAEVSADKTQKSNGWEIGYQTFTLNGLVSDPVIQYGLRMVSESCFAS